jgi:hypothetical protein
MPRPILGCSAIDDNDELFYSMLIVFSQIPSTTKYTTHLIIKKQKKFEKILNSIY